MNDEKEDEKIKLWEYVGIQQWYEWSEEEKIEMYKREFIPALAFTQINSGFTIAKWWIYVYSLFSPSLFP